MTTTKTLQDEKMSGEARSGEKRGRTRRRKTEYTVMVDWVYVDWRGAANRGEVRTLGVELGSATSLTRIGINNIKCVYVSF